jgi:hypothetical protein
MGDIAEEIGADAVGCLEDANLLLRSGQADRHRGRLTPLPLEPLQLLVGGSELRSQLLSPDLGPAPPRTEHPEPGCRAPEDDEVHDVRRIGDGERPVRRDEEEVDKEKAGGRADQGGRQTLEKREGGDEAEVEEDVVPALGQGQGPEDGGEGNRSRHSRSQGGPPPQPRPDL